MKDACARLFLIETYMNTTKLKRFGNKDLSILLILVPGIEKFIKKNGSLHPNDFADKLNDFVGKWIIEMSNICERSKK